MPESILMLILFVFYFVVPLIPTVTIYKLFPATRVTAKGPFKGINVNASGAFAAYMISLISGVFIVVSIMNCITNESDYLWKVYGQVKIINASTSEEVDDNVLREIMKPLDVTKNSEKTTDKITMDGKIISTYVSKEELENGVRINFDLTNCAPTTLYIDYDKSNKDIIEYVYYVLDFSKKVEFENLKITYLGDINKTESAPEVDKPPIKN